MTDSPTTHVGGTDEIGVREREKIEQRTLELQAYAQRGELDRERRIEWVGLTFRLADAVERRDRWIAMALTEGGFESEVERTLEGIDAGF